MENGHNHSHDSKAFRARLDQRTGREFWRGLEELVETEDFQAFLEDEFPQQARPLQMPVDRRQFLTLMGASLAMAGLSGCRFLPQDKIVPYVNKPEELIPGVAMWYTTAMTLSGNAIGLIAESHEGRPTKLEGNPQHPASLGATNALAQAAVLSLYDPDRSANVTKQGDISTWLGSDGFAATMRTELAKQAAKGGAGLRLLTETVVSPTLKTQIKTLLARYPQAKWVQYEPVNNDNANAGAKLAFGDVVQTVYRFDKADVVLALDADFMLSMPGSVRYARDFMDQRRIRRDHDGTMNRLYAVESSPTLTGATADNHLNLRSSDMEGYVRALAAALGVPGFAPAQTVAPAKWVQAVATDLKNTAGRSVVVVGPFQPPVVHAIGHAINQALGNVGSTLIYTIPVEADTANQIDALRGLVDEMNAGQVEMLFVLGGNPVYTSPADIDFAKPLRDKKVPFSVHLGLHEDETSDVCGWHVPETHFLEAWSDTRAFEGTVSIVQPLIEPLFDGKSQHDMLATLLATVGSSFDVLHNNWKSLRPGPDFDAFWEKCLLNGVVDGTAYPATSVTLNPNLAATLPAPAAPSTALEIIFRPDPTIWDGRFANNGWLQELPKPLAKISWENAAFVSPRTAVALGLGDYQNAYDDITAAQANERVVELNYKGRKVEAPVWVLPTHPDNAITVYLGYGRTRAGNIGNGIGFNAGLLRTSDSLWSGTGLTVNKLDSKTNMATTQYHHSMAGRNLIRTREILDFRSNPEFAEAENDLAGSSNAGSLTAGHGTDRQWGSGGLLGKEESASIYDGKEHAYDGYAWGMSVDLTTCIGCNACVQACQAENNIPVVGKDQVMRGRDMHWLRIDTYYRGMDTNKPEGTYFQPVMCMHCELAPCEPVCPVAATVHSHEGLNQMIYNRCVGTKYCSNNCPYKVRRFNFYKYIAGQPNNPGTNYDIPIMKLSANPNVTLRGRGVMEKCTFCVQRINSARITAKKEDRLIRDGEIQTACQQACPTRTIVFGNIADPNAEVTKLKQEPHDYSLLGDLDTRPRLTYLAKIQNPNPELLEPTKS